MLKRQTRTLAAAMTPGGLDVVHQSGSDAISSLGSGHVVIDTHRIAHPFVAATRPQHFAPGGRVRLSMTEP